MLAHETMCERHREVGATGQAWTWCEGSRTRQLIETGRCGYAGRVVGDRCINSEGDGRADSRVQASREWLVREGSGLVGIAVVLRYDVVAFYSAAHERCAGTAPNSTHSLTDCSRQVFRGEVCCTAARECHTEAELFTAAVMSGQESRLDAGSSKTSRKVPENRPSRD
jgi:hypothetical protein